MILFGSIGGGGALILLILLAMLLMPSDAGKATIVLDLPSSERGDATIRIDGEKMQISPSGELAYKVEPGDHRVEMERPGYESISRNFNLKAGKSVRYDPTWRKPFGFGSGTPVASVNEPNRSSPPNPGFQQPKQESEPHPADVEVKGFPQPKPQPKTERNNPPPRKQPPRRRPPNRLPRTTEIVVNGTRLKIDYSDWSQDLAAAKQQATQNSKDILILFTQTDEIGAMLQGSLIFQPQFRTQAKEKFVLVCLDYPKQRSALSGGVKNKSQNDALKKRYKIEQFPQMMLTDSSGVPFGAIPSLGGVSLREFNQYAESAQKHRQERDQYFAAIQAADGVDRVRAAAKALEWLGEQNDDPEESIGFKRIYRPIIEGWYELAKTHDPQNEHGLQEQFFEVVWLIEGSGLIWLDEDEQIKKIDQQLKVLNNWEKQHKFQDADRGARLHLYAAMQLDQLERVDEAAKHLQAGLAYGPKDPQLSAQLKQGVSSIRRAGTGSGFVVANNYMMTNHHVIQGEGDVVIQVPDPKNAGEYLEVPAEVVASDEERDMAVLKFETPAGVKLRPLPVSGADQGRGKSVAAFGYPLGDTLGAGLKLTRGIISSTPEASNNSMLVLDCRINPGNSGGPLCDQQGNVIGMVTAKFGGFQIDSYGMALPGPDLQAFLKKHIPGYRPIVNRNRRRLEWDELDPLIAPSVLMVVKLR